MSEHQHRVFHSGATEDPIVPVCSECGKDLMVLYMELEQRLAEATALLDEMTEPEPIVWREDLGGWLCPFCDEVSAGVDGKVYHSSDCRYKKARAFLSN